MIHFYTYRRFRGEKFKTACNPSELVEAQKYEPVRSYRAGARGTMTTSPHFVTCPKCLEFLIRRSEELTKKLFWKLNNGGSHGQESNSQVLPPPEDASAV